MRVVAVYYDRRTQRIEVHQSIEDGVRCVQFCPRALRDVVLKALGPEPPGMGIIEMEFALAERVEHGRHARPVEDPRQVHRAKAVEVLRSYVARYLGGTKPPVEVIEAMLDGEDWRAAPELDPPELADEAFGDDDPDHWAAIAADNHPSDA